MYWILASVLVTGQEVNLSYENSSSDSNVLKLKPLSEVFEIASITEPLDCFDYAEFVTGFSAEILRGIAATESCFKVKAVGDDGMSIGMFQLHSKWHESRVEKWGEFDPTDPFESAVIAGWIMQENLIAFNGDLRTAIAAYRQGVSGVTKRGVIQQYVDDVLNWRNNPEKVSSFFIFCGIMNTERSQDEHRDSGAQDKYKPDNSLAVQVSWRRSGSIPY
jgi:hypothetical protein